MSANTESQELKVPFRFYYHFLWISGFYLSTTYLLSIHLSIYLYLSIYLSLSIYLHLSLSIYLYLSISIYIYKQYLKRYLLAFTITFYESMVPIYLHTIYLSIYFLSTFYLSIYLSTYSYYDYPFSVCLSVELWGLLRLMVPPGILIQLFLGQKILIQQVSCILDKVDIDRYLSTDFWSHEMA